VDQDGQSQVCSSEAPSITYKDVVLMVIRVCMHSILIAYTCIHIRRMMIYSTC
jgi:hypothetical protein